LHNFNRSIYNVAVSSLAMAKKQFQAKSNLVLSRHKNVYVDINLDAPVMIIAPEISPSTGGRSGKGLILDLGKISLVTDRVAGLSAASLPDTPQHHHATKTNPQSQSQSHNLLTASQLMRSSRMQIASPSPKNRQIHATPPANMSPRMLPSTPVQFSTSPNRNAFHHRTSVRSNRGRSNSNLNPGASSMSDTNSEFAWNYNNNAGNQNNANRRRSKVSERSE